MRRRHGFLPIALLALWLAACGKKAEPVLQPPTDTGNPSGGPTTTRPTPPVVNTSDPAAGRMAAERRLEARRAAR